MLFRSNAEVKGLKAFAPQDRPPVFLVFWAFRVMVGLGVAMIGLGAWGAWLTLQGGPERSRLFLTACVAMGPAGFVSVDDSEIIGLVEEGVSQNAEAESLCELGGREVADTDTHISETLIRGMYEYYRKVMEI